MRSNDAPLVKNDRLGKAIAAAVLFAVVATALAHGAVEPWSVMMFELICLAVMALWATRMIVAKRVNISVPATAYPAAALIVLGLFQSIAFTREDGSRWSLSYDVEATRETVVVFLFLFILFVAAYNFFDGRERLSALASFLVAYGLALAIFALVQHFTWNGKFFWLRPNTVSTSPFGPFVNHNHFAGYMELLMPLPVGLVLARAVRREARLLYGFAAIVMGVTIAASLSRGGMVSMAAAMLFLIVAGSRLARKPSAGFRRDERAAGISGAVRRLAAPVSRVGVVIVIAGAILAGILWLGPESVITRVTEGQPAAANHPPTFLSNRDWVWRDTISMIRDNPLLGVGLGAYGTAFSIYTESNGAIRVPEAHNDYLQVVADGGILGGIIALWFLALIFKSIWRGINHGDPLVAGLALGCGGGMTAILVHSLIDFNLQLPANALLFLLLTAIVSRVAATAAEPAAAVAAVGRGGIGAKPEVSATPVGRGTWS